MVKEIAAPTPREAPADLRVWIVDEDATAAVVTFSLSRCAALTSAERDVARRACAGEGNRVIARARGTSVRTVANQLASIMRKLRVGSRKALATIPEVLA